MVEMSMNKVIHGAIRRDLGRFVDALERFQDGDSERASELQRAWTQFENQLEHHHTGEHAIAWPALRAVGVSPELLAEMDAEHQAMSAAIVDVHASFAALQRESASAQAAAALAAVRELQAVAVRHLEHEEADLEPVYLANQDTSEIKAMGRAFGRAQSPADGGRFFAWVTDGASAEEVAAVKSEVPAPVLAIVGGIFGRGYRKTIAPVWTR